MGEALDLLEHEDGTQARWKTGDGQSQVDRRFMIRSRFSDRRLERRRCAHFLAAHATERDTDRDALQPAEQGTPILIPSQCLRQTDKDVVNDIFRLGRRHQQPERYREQHARIPVIENAERGLVTGRHEGDDIRVTQLRTERMVLVGGRGHSIQTPFVSRRLQVTFGGHRALEWWLSPSPMVPTTARAKRFIYLPLIASISLAFASAPAPPELFASGRISTGDMELNAAFTPDGRILYYTKRTPKLQLWVIVVSQLRHGQWSSPEIAPFSGQYSDFDPFISPDGRRLYFSSNRPVEVTGRPRTDFDLWYVERTATGWSEPRHLDAPVNSPAQEFYPTVTKDGTLYFSSNRAGGAGGGDIYRVRFVDGRYAEPENLGDSINAATTEGDPYISPDEKYLIFVSYNRQGASGDGDLYISLRRDGHWSKAENLGPEINSSALDFCPVVSPDGKWLYFTSERGFADGPQQRRLTSAALTRKLRGPGNGLGDIYRVDLRPVLAGRLTR